MATNDKPVDGQKILDAYLAADAILVKKGHHATHSLWITTLAEFWLSGATRLVLRCGRQAGKSTTLERVIVATILGGVHAIARGTRGTIVCVSVRQVDALARLRGISQLLDDLKIPYSFSGDTISLTKLPIDVKVFPASSRTAVGMTSIAVFEDEMARWHADDTKKNPATEVDAALVPSTITQPNARIYSTSSPLGLEDYHAQLFALGSTEHQRVAAWASWESNPSITEARTHRIQPDERKWRREFAAIPQGSALGAFDPDAIENAFRNAGPLVPLGAPVIACDPAGRGSDGWAFMSAGWCKPDVDAGDEFLRRDIVDANGNVIAEKVVFERDEDGDLIRNPDFEKGGPVVAFGNFHLIDSSYKSQITAEQIVGGMAHVARYVGARKIVSDQYEAFALDSLAQRYGLRFEPYAWAAQIKAQAVGRVRAWLSEGRIIISPDEPLSAQLKKELLAYEERITANGMTYGGTAPSGGHFDLLSCVITTAMAEINGDLFGGPLRKSHRVLTFGPGDFANT